MSQQALTTIATRHQVFLERLKTQTAVDFSSVLPKISDAIAEIMSKLDVDTMDKLTRNQLRGLLIDLKLKQSELINKAQEKLVDDLKALNKYETDFEARTLEGALAAGGASKIALKVPTFPSSWKSTIQQPLSATGQLLEPFISGWGESQVAGVDAAVMKAWGEGRTVSQLMRDIRGTKSLNYQDGLAAVSRRQAEAIARTSVQHVAQQARMATWDENSDLIIGYTFVATLDGRTTSKCRSLDGQTFEMGKGPVPPVHVNCRSTTIPKLPKEFDFLDEGATRSSKDGYVAADQTYYGWLKTQPESFQDEVLGPSRAKLFREGGLTAEKFAALNMGKNFEPMTLAQMQVKEPQLFDKTGVVVKKPIVGPDLTGEARQQAEAAAAAEARRQAEAALERAKAAEAAAKAAAKPVKFIDAKFSLGQDTADSVLYSKLTGKQQPLPVSYELGDGYAALSNYKGAGYRGMNQYLRQGTVWNIDDTVNVLSNGVRKDITRKEYIEASVGALDSLMKKSVLSENIYLYRGFSLPDGMNFDDISDFTFTDKGFISASADRAVAERFTFGEGNPNIFKIRAPKGTNGIAVEDRLGDGSGGDAEREVLLPRGTTFRFTGDRQTKTLAGQKVNIYEVEIVTE
jgi:SPP1 gp7 family putative phage head morphogenesis protein